MATSLAASRYGGYEETGGVGSEVLRYAAGALSLTAAVIHFAAAPGHLQEWWAYGLFFLAVATAQGFYAVLLLRGAGPRLLLAGILGNLAVAALWGATRTVGVPFVGPHAWEAEAVGATDLAATSVELALVAALVALLARRYRKLAGGLLLGLCVAGVFAGGAWGLATASTPPPSAALLAAPGEPVEAAGGILRVDQVLPEKMAPMQMDKFAKTGMNMSGMVSDMTPEGERRFNVEVTLAAEDRALDYEASDFRVTGAGMRPTAPLRDKLVEGTIPAGKAVSGTLVFQVPEETERLALSFDGSRPVDLELEPASGKNGHGGH